MAVTRTWDETAPDGTEAANTLETIIQNVKTDVRERLEVDHDVSDDDSGVTLLGGHKKISLVVQATSPSAAADTGLIFVKDVSAKVELYWRDEDGDELVFTSGGHYLWTEAKNLILGTTTGSKIGTAAAQKLGFWNTTPAVQPSHVTDPAATASDITDSTGGSASGTHTLVDVDTTFNQANINNNFATVSAEYNSLKDDVEANNTAVDSILADLATIGLQAAS